LLEESQFPPFSTSEETGSVTLALDVDEHGNASNIHIAKSSDPKWEEEVVAAVRKWRFDPARREGTPITVPVTLDFTRVGAAPPGKAQ
jgi:TonB family protein